MRRPTRLAISAHSSMEMPATGTNGTTSVAPMRGCSPSWPDMSTMGMAIASKWLAATYNRPGLELFDFDTYALCSDGDLMEGVAQEAASLAGHLKLSNLCWL